jgi:hypothetical protein
VTGKGRKHSPEALGPEGSIARGTRWALEKRRRIARIAPAEILELQRSGTLSASLRPFAAQAIEESLGFLQALGGDEGGVSEQRMALVQDAARAGLVMRALMAKVLQGDDPDGDTISKICSLINARRANLTEIGLDRVSQEMDVSAYVAKHDAENPPGETIEAKSKSSSGPADVVVTASEESSASGHPRASESSRSPDGAALIDSPEPRDADTEETEPNPSEGA